MSMDLLTEHRREVLSEARGQVLEIGFGTGLNLLHYPESVEQLTAIDRNPGMLEIAKRRLERATFPVTRDVLDGESLPLESDRFDTAVSTWTLCSIDRPEVALAELRRVLKPGGQFLFVEHGLSPDAGVQVWQHRLNPVQKVIADGCNLNRDIPEIVESAQFEIEHLDRVYLPNTPKWIGYTYKGKAIAR